jgi:hypothetical protein
VAGYSSHIWVRARALSLGNPLIWLEVVAAALLLGGHWALLHRARR